jgi:hypothetical protein
MRRWMMLSGFRSPVACYEHRSMVEVLTAATSSIVHKAEQNPYGYGESRMKASKAPTSGNAIAAHDVFCWTSRANNALMD